MTDIPDIATILEIVRSDQAREIKDCIVYTILMASVGIPCAFLLFRKLYRCFGIFFCMICAGFLHSMATKPPTVTPQITWTSGLYNNNSSFNTNTWKTIHFRWNHYPTVSPAETIYFAAKHKDYPELEYSELGYTSVGIHSWDYTFSGSENATNYLYYAFTLGDVHTNGVWLGSILQKELPGTCGPDKMVIIRGKLLENGKVIAPFKENETK